MVTVGRGLAEQKQSYKEKVDDLGDNLRESNARRVSVSLRPCSGYSGGVCGGSGIHSLVSTFIRSKRGLLCVRDAASLPPHARAHARQDVVSLISFLGWSPVLTWTAVLQPQRRL